MVSRRFPYQSIVDPAAISPVVASGRSSTLAFGESAEYLGLQGTAANPGSTKRSHRGSALRTVIGRHPMGHLENPEEYGAPQF